jgi:hypothetical protein
MVKMVSVNAEYPVDHVQAVHVHRALLLVKRSMGPWDALRNVLVDPSLAGITRGGRGGGGASWARSAAVVNSRN